MSTDFFDTQSFTNPAVDKSKRILDVTLASAALLLLAPLFPLLALMIKLDSPGPVFFKQRRVGQAFPGYTHLFWMYKFRSMRQDAEAGTGPVWAAQNDNRITRFGRFLRKSRLDELPQLINVIRGDMSLIGPRPERPRFCKKLERAIPYYIERTYGLRPGITGMAQVNQGYDETLDDVRAKLIHDHHYALCLNSVARWIKADIAIIWRTLVVMACGRGQ